MGELTVGYAAMLLTTITFVPTLGALALVLLDRRDERRLRLVALTVSLATFLVSLLLWILFDRRSDIRLPGLNRLTPKIGIAWRWMYPKMPPAKTC